MMKGSFVEQINNCITADRRRRSLVAQFGVRRLDWLHMIEMRVLNLKIEAFRLRQFRIGMNMPDQRTIDLCQ